MPIYTKWWAQSGALPEKKSTGSKTLHNYFMEKIIQVRRTYTTISVTTNATASLQLPALPLTVNTCLPQFSEL